MATIKLTQPQCERLRRLLHMEYTISELAAELECPRRTIERAIEQDAPHHRDVRNRIHLVGDAFAEWYKAQPQKQKATLGPDEAYCLRCKSPQPFTVEEVRPNSPRVERAVGRCAQCGATVNRLREVAR